MWYSQSSIRGKGGDENSPFWAFLTAALTSYREIFWIVSRRLSRFMIGGSLSFKEVDIRWWVSGETRVVDRTILGVVQTNLVARDRQFGIRGNASIHSKISEGW